LIYHNKINVLFRGEKRLAGIFLHSLGCGGYCRQYIRQDHRGGEISRKVMGGDAVQNTLVGAGLALPLLLYFQMLP
jgi:hypothetical protein